MFFTPYHGQLNTYILFPIQQFLRKNHPRLHKERFLKGNAYKKAEIRGKIIDLNDSFTLIWNNMQVLKIANIEFKMQYSEQMGKMHPVAIFKHDPILKIFIYYPK